MPADLFDYWQAYASIRPFGYENQLLAQIASIIYNINRGENPAMSIEDFIPIKLSNQDIKEHQMEKALVEAMKRNQEKK